MKNKLKVLLKNFWNFIKLSVITVAVLIIDVLFMKDIMFDFLFEIEDFFSLPSEFISDLSFYSCLLTPLIIIAVIAIWRKYIIFSRKDHFQNILSFFFVVFFLILYKFAIEWDIGIAYTLFLDKHF